MARKRPELPTFTHIVACDLSEMGLVAVIARFDDDLPFGDIEFEVSIKCAARVGQESVVYGRQVWTCVFTFDNGTVRTGEGGGGLPDKRILQYGARLP